jgi:hypothetical protein
VAPWLVAPWLLEPWLVPAVAVPLDPAPAAGAVVVPEGAMATVGAGVPVSPTSSRLIT